MPPQTIWLRGQKNALQPPQADGLGTLNCIQPVSSWTVHTGVEEKKNTFWCSPAMWNLRRGAVLACTCVLQAVCSCYLLLCFALHICSPVGGELQGCAAAWLCSLGNMNNFFSKPCSMLWGWSGFDIFYSVCSFHLCILMLSSKKLSSLEIRLWHGEKQASSSLFPLRSTNSHLFCVMLHSQHSSVHNSKILCFQ